jgi:SAM-dependent methyltransferase
MDDDARLKREQEYHDKYFAGGDREPTQKFYTVFGASTDLYEKLLIEHGGPGKTVLEYGCGEGKWSYAYFLAERGAQVIGIDISPVAIEIARQTGDVRGLSTNLTFRVMNAEALEFADGTFDLICGSAILHHLDLDRSYSELARVLKPGGIAVFSEPLGHNPAINFYRNRTPEFRTPDEHPLRAADIALANRYFGKIEWQSFYLIALFGVPFRGMRWYPVLRNALSAADRALFRLIPFLRRYAWIGIIALSEPRKKS